MTIVRILRPAWVALALCGVFAVSAFAQPAAYQFTAPSGWARAAEGDAIVFTPKDEPSGSARLTLMPVKPQQGDFDPQFAAERGELERVLGLRDPQATSPQRGRSKNGEFGAFSASYSSDNGDRYVLVMALAAKGAFGTVAFVATNSDAFNRLARHATATFDSLKMTETAATVASRRPKGGAGTATDPTAGTTPARSASIATVDAPASGSIADVSYNPPSGWTRSKSGNATLLVRTVDLGFGLKNDFRLMVFPAERVQGSPSQTFTALWKRLIEPVFVSSMRPLPLRVRLKGGAALLYDGDTSAVLRQNNSRIGAFLYMATDGGTAVPIVGMFTGWDAELKRGLDGFFAGLRLGSGGKAAPLFAYGEIVGTWRSSSSVLGNWVDAHGNYRGDASVATGETMTIRADGSCESQFAAIGGGRGTVRQHDTGRCAVEDDMLVFPSGGGPRRYRITGVGRSADAKAGFLILGITRDDYPDLHAGSRQPGAGNLYVGVR